jgi:hypothetical protein
VRVRHRKALAKAIARLVGPKQHAFVNPFAHCLPQLFRLGTAAYKKPADIMMRRGNVDEVARPSQARLQLSFGFLSFQIDPNIAFRNPSA